MAGRWLVGWPAVCSAAWPTTCLGLQEDFVVGRKLAAGGFGTVYRATLVDRLQQQQQQQRAGRGTGKTVPTESEGEQVILKKATEFGEAGGWHRARVATGGWCVGGQGWGGGEIGWPLQSA